MLRRVFYLVLVVSMVFCSWAPLVHAQTTDTLLKQYLRAGEHAYRLKSVVLNGQTYDVFYLGTNTQKVFNDGSVFANYAQRDLVNWQKETGVTGIVVLNNGQPVYDNKILRQVLLSETIDTLMYRTIISEKGPLDSAITSDIDRYFSSGFVPLVIRFGAFGEQEIIQSLITEADCYAEALRMMLIADKPSDQIQQQIDKDLQDFADNTITIEQAVERLITLMGYSSVKAIRTQLSKELDSVLRTWRGWQADGKTQGWSGKGAGGYDLNILGTRVTGTAVFDILKLIARASELNIRQSVRLDQLETIQTYLRIHPEKRQVLGEELASAIDTVVTESQSQVVSVLDAVKEFVLEKAVSGILDMTTDTLVKQWIPYIFHKLGTVGHLRAGAASVLLAFTIANLLYGMDAVVASTYNARYADFSYEAFGNLAYAIKTGIGSNQNPLDGEATGAYGASFSFRKFSEAAFYRAMAERSEAPWSLKIIIDWLYGGAMTEGIEGWRAAADTVEEYLLPYWVHPPVIDSALSLVRRTGGKGSYTALVLDVSGSMSELDQNGAPKIEASKEAARQLLRQLAQDNQVFSTDNQVALVTFSTNVSVLSSFSTPEDILLKVDALSPQQNTALGAGLAQGLDLLDTTDENSNRYLILMSDGIANVGLTTLAELQAGPGARAQQMGVCLFTVAFGQDANEILLQGLATGSSGGTGCGGFYRASNAFDLRTIYARAATETNAQNVNVFTGIIKQGQTLDVCTYEVPAAQAEATFHLLWPGSKLGMILYDPNNREVTPDGRRVRLISDSPTSQRIIVNQPLAGSWRVVVKGIEVSLPDGEPFSVITSTIIQSNTTSSGFSDLVFILILGAGVIAGVVFVTISARSRKHHTGKGTVQAVLMSVNGRRNMVSSGGTIGRSPSCNLRLSDSTVSRTHARLSYANGSWFIQDLGSKAGTIVNATHVEAIKLQHGDRIQLGESTFIFVEEAKNA